ncbi:MAG: 2-phospho-L-lactate guanylyltransferase [Rhizobiaceae bacterium]|nr:2-phospho-L-lactate guanylyltransferase [Rhizobiaceae bacterium]
MADLLAIVPCKPFRLGKSRLAPVLSPAERAALCESFLAGTLARLGAMSRKLDVLVLTSDPVAEALAAKAGAHTLDDRGLGLNATLRLARAATAGTASRFLVLPTDLPCADAAALGRLLDRDAEMVIAPDRAGTGTNVMALGKAAFRDFPFAYGLDSYDRHLAAAAEGGWRAGVVRDPALALDIDTPDDLASWRGCGNPDRRKAA